MIFSVAEVAFGESLTPASKLVFFLKELVIILQNAAIIYNNNSMKIHYENLLKLFDTSWTYISAPKRRKLNEQKPPVVEMPVTNDIKIFLDYISFEISKYIKELSHDKILLISQT